MSDHDGARGPLPGCECGYCKPDEVLAERTNEATATLRAEVAALKARLDEARREQALEERDRAEDNCRGHVEQIADLESELATAEAGAAELRDFLRRTLPSVQFANLLGLADEINKALASTTAGAELLARHEAELESMRERAAKACADHRGGFTVDCVSGALVPDSDGPWDLNSRFAAAIRSLPLREKP